MLMARGRAKSTVTSKNKHTEEWRSYTHDVEVLDDPLLSEVPVVADKVGVVVDFIHWLYDKGLREKQVAVRLAAVKTFLSNHLIDVGFWDWPAIAEAKKGTRMTTAEIRSKGRRRKETVILPAPDEMLEMIRDRAFNRAGWDRIGTQMKGSCLAIVLMAITGYRPSSIVGGAGRSSEDDEEDDPEDPVRDHTTLVSDMVFMLEGGGRVRAGTEGRTIANGLVVGVEIASYTNKTGVVASTDRQLPTESIETVGLAKHEFAQDLQDFLGKSGSADGDPLFTVLAWGKQKVPKLGRKVTTQHDMRTLVKWSAGQLDLPVQHFSLSSFRKAYATNGSLQGVDLKTTQAAAGWKAGSRATATHYDFAPQMGRHGGNGGPRRRLSVSDVRSLIPLASSDGASSGHIGGGSETPTPR